MSAPKKQPRIVWVNNAKATFDPDLLEKAILWWADGRNTMSTKVVGMYGEYPCVAIYHEKIHIHRLIKGYLAGRKLATDEYVNHIDENKLNASENNLELLSSTEHQRMTNLGRKQTATQVAKRIDATTKTRYGHSIYENPELLND